DFRRNFRVETIELLDFRPGERTRSVEWDLIRNPVVLSDAFGYLARCRNRIDRLAGDDEASILCPESVDQVAALLLESTTEVLPLGFGALGYLTQPHRIVGLPSGDLVHGRLEFVFASSLTIQDCHAKALQALGVMITMHSVGLRVLINYQNRSIVREVMP